MIARPLLRYLGGKFRLAPWIIGHFPPHRAYIEPFGGAASVLLQKDRAYIDPRPCAPGRLPRLAAGAEDGPRP